MRCRTEIAERYDFSSCEIGSPAKVNEAAQWRSAEPARSLPATRSIFSIGLNGLVAEQVWGDRVPWSTERYCEKPDSGPSGDLICVGKSLILRDLRGQIPYGAEQGNKPGEQGDKIYNQRIKSAKHGKAPQVRSGRPWRAEWGSLGCGRSAFSIPAITLATARLTAARAPKARACNKVK